MANREQVARLRRSVAEWNQWRDQHPHTTPDLRGADLRGCDLQGANLRGADIRSTNFGQCRQGPTQQPTNLTSADFTAAQAGLRRRTWLLQLGLVLLLATLAGFFSAFMGGLLASIPLKTNSSIESLIYGIVSIAPLLVSGWAILHQGLTFRALNTVIISFTIALVMSGFLAVAGSFAGSFTVAGAFAMMGTLTFAVAGSLARSAAGTLAVVGTLVITESIARSMAIAIPSSIAFAVFGSFTVFGLVISHKAIKGDPKFAVVRQLALSFAAWGGTNFAGANLAHAQFSQAVLRSTNFDGAILRQTQLTAAQRLDLANPGNTLFADPAVRDLLVDPSTGYGKNFHGINLRGVYLVGANLENAILTFADLGNADLSGANLKAINLREANCIGTDFSRAYLTGACLEAWNIDHTTRFTAVDCQYIYQLEQPNALDSRERRPHDPNKVFAPGDFAKLFTEASNIVELLIRNGLDPDAFSTAFRDLMDRYDITPQDIQSISKQGDDVLIQVQVPETTDKGEFERQFDQRYAEQTIARLEAERDSAERLAAERDQDKQQLLDIVRSTLQNLSDCPVQPPINIQNQNQTQTQNQAIAMIQGDTHQSGQFGIGQMSGGSIQDNAQVGGSIHNAAAPGLSAQDILALLQQLHTTLHSSPDLPPDLQTKTLRYLDAATVEAQEPQPDKAIMGSNLKKMGSLLQDASGTVEAAQGFWTVATPIMTKLGTWLGMALF